MAFLTIQELNTHLHDELVETITRGDATIAEAAIDAAIAEAKGYLTRFDCTRIFSASGSKRNQLLLIFVKDVSPDLPDRETEEETGSNTPIGPIAYGSNPKRCQHF